MCALLAVTIASALFFPPLVRARTNAIYGDESFRRRQLIDKIIISIQSYHDVAGYYPNSYMDMLGLIDDPELESDLTTGDAPIDVLFDNLGASPGAIIIKDKGLGDFSATLVYKSWWDHYAINITADWRVVTSHQIKKYDSNR